MQMVTVLFTVRAGNQKQGNVSATYFSGIHQKSLLTGAPLMDNIYFI